MFSDLVRRFRHASFTCEKQHARGPTALPSINQLYRNQSKVPAGCSLTILLATLGANPIRDGFVDKNAAVWTQLFAAQRSADDAWSHLGWGGNLCFLPSIAR